jgi:hypothetical protein
MLNYGYSSGREWNECLFSFLTCNIVILHLCKNRINVYNNCEDRIHFHKLYTFCTLVGSYFYNGIFISCTRHKSTHEHLNWNEIVNPTSALIGTFRNASSTNDQSINFIHVSCVYNMKRYKILPSGRFLGF